MASRIDMSGKVAIVTGGGRGVGRGITERLLEHGADVVICGRSEIDDLPAAGGRTASFVQADVRDPTQVQAVVDAAIERHGRLDVMVPNAGGTGAPNDTATVSPRYHAGVIALNLTAALDCACAAYRVMAPQPEGGSIVFISSVSASYASVGTAAYGAAKAGVDSLGRTLSVEWAPKVRVNVLTAGFVITEQTALHYGADGGAAVAATIPMGRLATPSDIGDGVLFLASEYAGFVTGANLLVHGGGERPAFHEAVESTQH
jgi:NAD(P)-dependent dehydrogenase (short-subunit alcohol dehydrogenase family)